MEPNSKTPIEGKGSRAVMRWGCGVLKKAGVLRAKYTRKRKDSELRGGVQLGRGDVGEGLWA